jgi:hypothetical protein
MISGKGQRTRSVIVIHKDRIIAEKYDTGFDKDSKTGLVDDQKHYGHHFLEYLKTGKL